MHTRVPMHSELYKITTYLGQHPSLMIILLSQTRDAASIEPIFAILSYSRNSMPL